MNEEQAKAVVALTSALSDRMNAMEARAIAADVLISALIEAHPNREAVLATARRALTERPATSLGNHIVDTAMERVERLLAAHEANQNPAPAS